MKKYKNYSLRKINLHKFFSGNFEWMKNYQNDLQKRSKFSRKFTLILIMFFYIEFVYTFLVRSASGKYRVTHLWEGGKWRRKTHTSHAHKCIKINIHTKLPIRLLFENSINRKYVYVCLWFLLWRGVSLLMRKREKSE